jgi:SAM-dependent methyltransferase
MEPNRPYLEPYLIAAEKFGAGFEALLWQSPKAQRLRFRTIATMAAVKGRVVADVGCGNADLMLDMVRRGRGPSRYIGVDGVPAMLTRAREVLAGAGVADAELIEADFVREAGLAEALVRGRGAQVVVFCGSLNTLPEAEAQGGARSVLGGDGPVGRGTGRRWCSTFCPTGTTGTGRPRRRRRCGFDPVRMVHWALHRTPMVTFRHDYLGGHDATVCMRVSPARGTVGGFTPRRT